MCVQVNESYLSEAVALSFPLGVAADDRLMLVLKGYFDESGTHGGSKSVSVAGYLSTAERWLAFEQEWKAAIDGYGLEHFHMTDFVARKGEYAHWGDTERIDRLANLVEIINRNVVASVGFALPMRHYYSTFSKAAKHYSGGAYGLAAISCFMDASIAVKTTHPDARIAYVFERGVKGRGQVMKIFDQICDNTELRRNHRLLSLTYEDKRDFVPLQAADILAYELYRHLPIHLQELSDPPRMNLSALQRCPINYWKTFDGETMERFAITVDMAARVYGAQGPKTKRRWK